MDLRVVNHENLQLTALFEGNDNINVDVKFSINYDVVVIKNFVYTYQDSEDKQCFYLISTCDSGTTFLDWGIGSTIQGQSQFTVNNFFPKNKFPNNSTWNIFVKNIKNEAANIKGGIIFNIEAIKMTI